MVVIGATTIIPEDDFNDGDKLTLYKELNGLVEDKHVGRFVAVTFNDKEDPYIGHVERRADVRKVGEDEKYWDIAFEGEKDKVRAIPLGDGEWEWEFLD